MAISLRWYGNESRYLQTIGIFLYLFFLLVVTHLIVPWWPFSGWDWSIKESIWAPPHYVLSAPPTVLEGQKMVPRLQISVDEFKQMTPLLGEVHIWAKEESQGLIKDGILSYEGKMAVGENTIIFDASQNLVGRWADHYVTLEEKNNTLSVVYERSWGEFLWQVLFLGGLSGCVFVLYMLFIRFSY
ncbi:MAG: hypothetical protein Q7S03_03735 [bacterium]|nr:hypothetical protein [bacterium]